MIKTEIQSRGLHLRIEEVLSEDQAYLMLHLLQGVVRSGSGNRMRREPYNLLNQIGGKTGTTQNHSNGWFMGVTPKYGRWCMEWLGRPGNSF